MTDSVNQKLDEILAISRRSEVKIDNMGERVDEIDERLMKLEHRVDHLGIKAVTAGGLAGLVVSVGIELIKAKFGG